jgi:hypothetical protein
MGGQNRGALFQRRFLSTGPPREFREDGVTSRQEIAMKSLCFLVAAAILARGALLKGFHNNTMFRRRVTVE